MYLVGVLVGGESSLRNKPTTPRGAMHHHHLSTLLFVSDLLAHWNCSHTLTRTTFLSQQFVPMCNRPLPWLGQKIWAHSLYINPVKDEVDGLFTSDFGISNRPIIMPLKPSKCDLSTIHCVLDLWLKKSMSYLKQQVGLQDFFELHQTFSVKSGTYTLVVLS